MSHQSILLAIHFSLLGFKSNNFKLNLVVYLLFQSSTKEKKRREDKKPSKT
jgi:hypothetical protein